MWFVFSMFSIGVCSYMIIQSIMQFFQFSVTSSVRLNSQNSMVFPVVSICNINPFTTHYALQFINEHSIEPNWLLYISNGPIFNTSLKKSFGYNATDFIRHCRFNGVACDLSKFEWYYRPDLGNCYKFNAGFDADGNVTDLNSIDRSVDGLYFEVFVGPSPIYNDNKSFVANDRGINLFIEDQLSYTLRNRGTLLKPGNMAMIEMHLSQSKTMPYPYSDCIRPPKIDTLLSKEMKKLGMKYSRRNCMVLCEQKSTIDQLGCYDLRLPRILDAEPCINETVFGQIKKLKFNFSECFDYCPFECKSNNYHLSVTYSDFPNYNYYRYLLNSDYDFYRRMFGTSEITYSLFKDNVASAFFYFDELKILQITESPSLNLINLLANIGGTFGLFIGISILSFVEVIELTIHVFSIWFRYIKDKF